MAAGGGIREEDGDAGGAPAWSPLPMTGGRGDEKKPWYHKDNYYPGEPRPAPGTPYGSRGAVIVRTDPCVIYDPDAEKNENFLKAMKAEDAEKYKGEWIGVAAGGVVAHGIEYARVYEEARKADKGEPFMHYVGPTEKNVLFLGFRWCYAPAASESIGRTEENAAH